MRKELSDSLETKLSYGDTIRWMIDKSASEVRDLIQAYRSRMDLEVRRARGLLPNPALHETVMQFKEIAKREDEVLKEQKERESREEAY